MSVVFGCIYILPVSYPDPKKLEGLIYTVISSIFNPFPTVLLEKLEGLIPKVISSKFLLTYQVCLKLPSDKKHTLYMLLTIKFENVLYYSKELYFEFCINIWN